MAEVDELPMFPLGSVLFPTAVLPLHVFEPRYRQMVDDCLAGDGHFGVVLIERGTEVGGGDVRSGLGTRAKILQSERFDDGRWGLVAVGTERLRVVEWLPDDPYPRALVEPWPDALPTRPLGDEFAGIVDLLRRALAAAAAAGRPAADPATELSDDPVVGTLQAAYLAPVGPADHQLLLGAPTPEIRTELLETTLREQIEVLEALAEW